MGTTNRFQDYCSECLSSTKECDKIPLRLSKPYYHQENPRQAPGFRRLVTNNACDAEKNNNGVTRRKQICRNCIRPDMSSSNYCHHHQERLYHCCSFSSSLKNVDLSDYRHRQQEQLLLSSKTIASDVFNGDGAPKEQNDKTLAKIYMSNNTPADQSDAILSRTSSKSESVANYYPKRRRPGTTSFPQINSHNHSQKKEFVPHLIPSIFHRSAYLVALTILLLSPLEISAENNVLPQFVLKEGQSEIVLRLKEGPATPTGSRVYKLKGIDRDGDPLTFGLRGQVANELLRIENLGKDEANLYLKKELDREVKNNNSTTVLEEDAIITII